VASLDLVVANQVDWIGTFMLSYEWTGFNMQAWTLWFNKMDYLLYVVYMYCTEIGCTNLNATD